MKALTQITGLILTLGVVGASAQSEADFPARIVTIIVPGGAGGPVDVGARLLADYLKREWSVPVVIENKSGGGGNVGSAYVSKAAPDGYTLLANLDSIAANVALYQNPGYDLKNSLAPVAMIATTSPIIATSPQLGVKTMAEFLSLAKSRASPLTVGHPGVGTTGHLLSELWRYTSQVDWTNVPYAGGGPAATALVGGHVDAFSGPATAVISQVKAGNVVALGVMAPSRMPELPAVPTVREQGFPDLETFNWLGVFAPGGTPPSVIAKMSNAMSQFSTDPQTKERFAKMGFQSTFSGPQEFAKIIETAVMKWSDVVEKARLEKR